MRVATGKALGAFLLVIALPLAGCMDDQGDDTDDRQGTTTEPPRPNDDDDAPSGAKAYGVRPLWFTGLHFTYDVSFPDHDVAGPMDITVLGDSGSFELTGNASDELILWSLFYHLPPLGPVEPGTFNPVIHDTPIAWFDFPLTDGKAWSAPDHHGTTVNYTTTETTTPIPGGRTVPGFTVVGERTGAEWVRYTYTAEIGWFTHIMVDGNGDGDVDAEMTLRDAGVNPNHINLQTFRPHALAVHTAIGIESLPNDASSFTIDETHTDVFVYFVMFGGPGQYSGFVTLPGEPPPAPLPGFPSRQYNWTNTDQQGVMIFGEAVDSTPGEGTIGGTPFTAEGGIFAEVLAVERTSIS